MMCSCREEEYERILAGTHHTQITAWWDRAADIIPLECGKGNAVRAVLQHFSFTKEEAIAFGDGFNDIEMLEAVGTGVAWGMRRMRSKLTPPARADRWKKTESTIFV